MTWEKNNLFSYSFDLKGKSLRASEPTWYYVPRNYSKVCSNKGILKRRGDGYNVEKKKAPSFF